MAREVWQGYKTLILILWLGDNVHPCLISVSPALKCSTTYNTFNLLMGPGCSALLGRRQCSVCWGRITKMIITFEIHEIRNHYGIQECPYCVNME